MLCWIFTLGGLLIVGTTTRTGVGANARVRQSTATKEEGGSAVRGTQEPDRAAPLASAEIEVRARAVLPGSGGAEHQAPDAIPQPTDNAAPAGHCVA